MARIIGLQKPARDREIVQDSVLKMLGWNICKVWTLDWWEDSQKVIDHIEAELKSAECGKSQRSVPVISLASGSGEVQKEGLLCHAQHCLVKLPVASNSGRSENCVTGDL